MWKLGAEAAQFLEKEYINGIAVAVYPFDLQELIMFLNKYFQFYLPEREFSLTLS
jgi:hypothetical protein